MTTRCNYELLLRRIICGIAYHPIARVIEQPRGTRSKAFEVYVDADDVGLIIGKKGLVIKSIQQIFRAIAAHNRMEMIGVFIKNTEKGSGVSKSRKNGWDEEEAIDLACQIFEACGCERIHMSIDRSKNCVAINYQPKPPADLEEAIHTVLKHYGKSYGKCFGLAI